ncbi:hypothetical protein HanHA300_Chr15g0568771 [Helianthus annuus]|nr:hypothetical protein HanHA300_Chr15g0568771 [Helianthus annuus]KAJ0473426.1 hypothetical protein HanHA89_Chr15g0618141 [Helianthus annuus]KAJ0649010.1 hypothetical protein HanLR1_Chr15g0579291 [Helianthus annuus]
MILQWSVSDPNLSLKKDIEFYFEKFMELFLSFIEKLNDILNIKISVNITVGLLLKRIR